MTDGVIKGDGTSRLAKASGWPETYEGFKALAESSGIPLDLIFNSSGWQQLPTFLSKATLLQDFTAQLLGLDPADNPTVDDAFLNTFLTASGAGLVKVQVYETGTKTPISGVLITGATDLLGNDLYADDTGLAVGLATAETSTLKVSTDYIDLTGQTTFSGATPAQQVTEVTLYAKRASNSSGKIETFSTSIQKRFTDKVKRVDVHAVGAGGGGNSGQYTTRGRNEYARGGRGGKQGYSSYKNAVLFTPNELFSITIGKGGAGGKNSQGSSGSDGPYNAGSTGGASSCLGVTGSGGGGGQGANGGIRWYDDRLEEYFSQDADIADSRTEHQFGETNLPVVPGGDGGGGGAEWGGFNVTGSVGGDPNGGDGGNYNEPGDHASTAGGGGGGGCDEYYGRSGGDGGNGIVYVRWFYA